MGFKKINVNVRLTGKLSEEQKREVIGMGPRFFPVYDLVTNAVPITFKLIE